MRDSYMLHNGQAQTGAPRRLTSAFIHAVKTLRQTRNVFGLNARPRILNRQSRAYHGFRPTEGNGPSLYFSALTKRLSIALRSSMALPRIR